MEERRRSTRVELNADFNHSTEEMIKGKNISEQGICIITEELYDMGKYFRRNFILPSGAGLSIFGKVMWSRGIGPREYESGIAIISLGKADRKHLSAYIKKKLKQKK